VGEGNRSTTLARLAVAGCLAIATACGQPNPSRPTSIASPTPAPSSSATVTGGTLRVAMHLSEYEAGESSPDGSRRRAFDPHGTASPAAWELFRCCLLRTLMSYNGLATAQGGSILRPDLAAAPPTVSADGLTWTFHLKPGLRYAPPYADTPIVAADLIRGLERSLRHTPGGEPRDTYAPFAFLIGDAVVGANAFTAGDVRSISGLEAPDPLTLVIHVISPTGDLDSRLQLSPATPIPAGAADAHDAAYGPYLVASGPYMIEGSARDRPASGYVPGKSLTLVRNPSWDRASDDLRKAIVDRIEITDLTGPDAEDGGLRLLQSNTVDVVLDTDLDGPQLAAVRADPGLAPRVHLTQIPSLRWIPMNIAQPPLDDVHVRRAISFAADRAQMSALLDPNWRIATHAVPDSMEAGLLADYDPFATPNHAGSVADAKREMAQSAYDTNHDGVCDAPACRAILTLVRGEAPRFGQAFENLRSTLEPLGLELKPKSFKSSDDFFHAVDDPRSHAGLGLIDTWSADYLSGSNWFVPLVASAGITGEANASLIGASAVHLREWGYTAPSVASLDTKIEECIAHVGFAQAECWAEADQFLTERIVAWVPLFSRQTARFTSNRVTQFSFDQSVALPALDQIALK
jgi:peptide/nickel transport system substrate-binding protein